MALNLTMRKKTHDEFKEEVYSLVNDEYTLLEEYKGAKSKIKIRHNICGHIYKVRPDAILRGTRCPECRVKAITKTHKQFVEDVYQAVENEYTVIGEYINSKNKISIKHNKCGNQYEVQPNVFLGGSRCPYCAGLKKKTTEEFKQEVFDLTGKEYSVLGKYKNTRTKIKMKHNKCGHVYEVIPNYFLQGTRCPVCKSFKGEQKIADFLIKNKIKFETQKTFEDLKDKKLLRFDFYIPDKNLLIEYDGKQHFEPVDFSGNSPEQADENFKNRKIRDKIKNNYCKENNIKLLRIKYTDFKNIKKILKEKLK